eukprot:COSAG04_NODE_842_length_9945_cov_4.243043_10_plen_82_part_00
MNAQLATSSKLSRLVISTEVNARDLPLVPPFLRTPGLHPERMEPRLLLQNDLHLLIQPDGLEHLLLAVPGGQDPLEQARSA